MNTQADASLRQSFDRLDRDESVVLESRPGVPEQVHVFDDSGNRSRLAVKAALAAGRPLLVRGEPGVGKTQLAAAAAKALGRPLVSFVVDARCESRDLLWHFDTVRRRAEAQICGVLKVDRDAVFEQLHVRRFIEPGPLWWGFDWERATQHCEEHKLDMPPVAAGTDPAYGRVVLIDEIDEEDSDLPNGLLEALGSSRFQPHGCDPVLMKDPAPLVIVTTNEERVLPDAFVRRCLVLHLALSADDGELKKPLVKRGHRHFPRASDTLLEKTAELLVADRRASVAPKPGQAEYFDLIRAITQLDSGGKEDEDLLQQVSEFTLKKQFGAG